MKKITNKKVGLTPAFTMIELIFVIVVLGILAAVAIPKFAATRDDAVLVKGKSQVSAIRSGIVMQKSKNLLEGKAVSGSYYPQTLETDATAKMLFNDNILEYGIKDKQTSGNWHRTSTYNANPIEYDFYLTNSDKVGFDYNKTDGKFDCNGSSDCLLLTQ